eukprot:Skav207376  [mRNA]  locus=scaffold2496:68276:75724:+ [translate_table: standard]
MATGWPQDGHRMATDGLLIALQLPYFTQCKWWDVKRDRTIGTPKLRSSSKFDEWAKKKVTQRSEEAKEEEGSRKQKDREATEAENLLKNSLLRDKAVASEVVNKKAMADQPSFSSSWSMAMQQILCR